MSRLAQLFTALAVLGTLGLLIFGLMVWNAVSVESMGAERAASDLQALREDVGGGAPLFHTDPEGNLVRRHPARLNQPSRRLRRLHAVAYRGPDEKLVRAKAPFWFVRLKEPAIRLFLRGTGVDLKDLGITAAELQEEGPGLVLDQIAENGDRVIVWTE